MRKEGLSPAKEADSLALLRRVYLDLTGIPPSHLEVDAFLNDKLSGAYERAVDRALASPRYGEKWARFWLDLARYADSDGYEKDTGRPFAWRYRQWVVDALNADMPPNVVAFCFSSLKSFSNCSMISVLIHVTVG